MIDFDSPYPPGVSINTSGLWHVDDQHANPSGTGKHLHLYKPGGNQSNQQGVVSIDGLDFTDKCRLRIGFYKTGTGCSGVYNQSNATVAGMTLCPTASGGIWEVDVSGVTGVHSISLWFNTNGTLTAFAEISIDNIVLGTDLDCDGNCVEDAVEISSDPTLDSNTNGILDSCEAGQAYWVRSPVNRRLITVAPPMTWSSARQAGAQIGARLAQCTSTEQNAWIASTFFGAPGWIGATDELEEGTWRWTDGDVLDFTAWAPGEPGNFAASQDYAAMWPATEEWTAWFDNTTHRAFLESEYEDCDGNYVPDDVDLAGSPSLDCDGDGQMDLCQLLDYPEQDCNEDGILDQCQLPNTALDCDGNGVLDSCEVASNPALDCNSNGLLDSCEQLPAEDDLNGDGQHDDCFPPTYCVGNPNSTGQGASIDIVGSPEIALNAFELSASNLPPFQWSYFLTAPSQGNASLGGGSQGVLCLGAPVLRLNRTNLGEIAQTTGAGTRTLQLDIAGPLPQGYSYLPGSTWHFQLWYRDLNPGPTSNTSEGISVMFR